MCDYSVPVLMKESLATYLGIISKLCKLDVIEQAASRLDDVFALLWSFLHFASEEKAASSCHLHTENNTHSFRFYSSAFRDIQCAMASFSKMKAC